MKATPLMAPMNQCGDAVCGVNMACCVPLDTRAAQDCPPLFSVEPPPPLLMPGVWTIAQGKATVAVAPKIPASPVTKTASRPPFSEGPENVLSFVSSIDAVAATIVAPLIPLTSKITAPQEPDAVPLRFIVSANILPGSVTCATFFAHHTSDARPELASLIAAPDT